MTTAFDLDLSLVLLKEGGKVDNKYDPGGRTNEGVTQRVYDAWRASRRLPPRDVYLIGAAEVRAIYHEQYATPLHVEQMPIGVGYAVFDGGVNSGVSRSAKWLQEAIGVVPDGHIGLVTLQALSHVADLDRLIDDLCDRRLGMLRRLPTWTHFALGWTRRVAFVRRNAHSLQHRPA